MKIYSKSYFRNSCIDFVIVIVAILSMIFRGFSVILAMSAIILFLFAITQLQYSLSEKKIYSLQTETDERNKLILLKTAHTSFRIMETVSFLVLFGLMIAYSVTKNSMVFGAYLVTCIYVFLTFLVALFANIYYEKHN